VQALEPELDLPGGIAVRMATANGLIDVVLSMAKTGRFKRVVQSFCSAGFVQPCRAGARCAVRPSHDRIAGRG
jgi:hypothetical protein